MLLRNNFLHRDKVICLLFIVLMTMSVGVSYAGAFDTSRPSTNGPTYVFIRMFMVDIDEVSSSQQRFSANFYYEAHWLDQRLRHDKSSHVSYPASQVWTPRLQLANQQRVWKTLPEVVLVDKNGNVNYRQRVWGDFSQPLKLHNFPFDKQTFSIVLLAAGYNPDEVKMEIYRAKEVGIADVFSLPDWDIVGWKMDNTPYAFTKQETKIPAMTFTITAKRHIGYYILMYIIPLLLIVGMSWIAFLIDIKESNTRISIAATSMLTLIAYRFIIGANLPRVSYLTLLDFIILASTLLVFATLILTASISLLMKKKKFSLANRIDFHLRWFLPLSFLLLIVIPFIKL